jgi:hypothetical protein
VSAEDVSRYLSLVVALSLTGCVLEAADEVGERTAALTPVTWTDVVGVSAAGNDLTKTGPENSFNAGAVSVESLSGDGFVEFTTGEATTAKACGLANGNGDPLLSDIDYAIRLNANGRASIAEGGTTRAAVGSYVAGDVFRVQALNEVVTYYRNGALLYTSELAPSFPLDVDTSLKTPGATIQDVVIDSLVFWGDVANADTIANDLVKTAPEDSYNAGAVSVATIPSGDGYVRFRPGDDMTTKAAGLGTANDNTSRRDIEHAFAFSAAGGVSIVESGVVRLHAGTYEADDTFAVQVVGGVVTYWIDGVLVYTSTVAPTYPLRLDTALRTPGSAIVDAEIAAGEAGRTSSFERLGSRAN